MKDEKTRHVFEDGRWFFADECQHIHKPYDQETLFLTKKGAWVLRKKTHVGSTSMEWKVLTSQEARAWLIKNELTGQLDSIILEMMEI